MVRAIRHFILVCTALVGVERPRGIGDAHHSGRREGRTGERKEKEVNYSVKKPLRGTAFRSRLRRTGLRLPGGRIEVSAPMLSATRAADASVVYIRNTP